MKDSILIKKEVTNFFSLSEINKSWFSFFFENDFFFPLLLELKKEYESFLCFPDKQDVFRIFKEISLDKIKVIILGQDPYYIPGVADGIAFSSKKKNFIPLSLKNIFLEFSRDLKQKEPVSGNLLPWVKEGVFLLNTALTIRWGKEKKTLTHAKIWENFIFSLINFLKNDSKKKVWVFWGNKAKEIKKKFLFSDEISIVSVHPSPLSVNYGFFGSEPFSKINKKLALIGIEPIKWEVILE